MKKRNYLNLFFIGIVFIGIGIIGFSYFQNISELGNASIYSSDARATTGSVSDGLRLLGAGISSIGFIGAGIGQGYAAGKAAEGVSRNPEAESKIRNMMIVGAAIAETSALYALVMGILLVFVAS